MSDYILNRETTKHPNTCHNPGDDHSSIFKIDLYVLK